jgi:hypothetical protein
MGEWAPLQIGTQSAQDRSTNASSQDLVNLYVSKNADGEPYPFTIYSTPGRKRFVSIDESKPTRGMALLGKTIFAVIGDRLYRVPLNGPVVDIGQIQGTRPVQIATVDAKLVINSDDFAYTTDGTSVLTVSQGGFCGVASQDGYAIFPERGTQNVYISQNDQPEVINPLDFTQADAEGSLNVGGICDGGQYWNFKELSIEVFADTGAAAFPFERQTLIEHGCSAAGSIAKADGAILFLDENLQVRMARGYQPEVISTAAVERSIKTQAAVSDAQAMTYKIDGSYFYELSFQGVTWVFDLKLGLWAKKTTRGLKRHAAQCAVTLNGKTYVGDYAKGVIYELDLETYKDDSQPVERILTCPSSAGPTKQLYAALMLICEMGVGTLDDERLVYLDWSKDGGKTYCDPVPATLGKLGEYGIGTTWNRLGSSKGRTFRFRILDDCRVAIQAAFVRTEQLQ